MLRTQPDPDPERVGWHLLHAGEHKLASTALLKAVQARADRGDLRRIPELLHQVEAALDAANAPFNNERAAIPYYRAYVAMWQGQLADAERQTRDLLVLAQQHGIAISVAFAERQLGSLSHRQGRTKEAIGHHQRALAGFRALDRHRWVGAALTALAELGQTSHPEHALELCLEAIEAYKMASYEKGALQPLIMITRLQYRAGQMQEAETRLVEAMKMARRIGARLWEAIILVDLGDTQQQSGNVAGARASFEQAVALFERLGAADAAIPRLNLALLDARQGRWAEAREALHLLDDELRHVGRNRERYAARALLMWCAAGQQDWGTFDRCLDEMHRGREHGIEVDEEVPGFLDSAARLAGEAGQEAREERANALAQQVRTHLRPAEETP
jgi:tetratricopeptide (TPR) repeat protein